MIEQVIFDADLTLIDSFVGVHGIYCLVADRLKTDRPTQTDLRRLWGRKIPDIIAGLFDGVDVDGVLKITYEEAEDRIHPLFPGVADSLHVLRASNLSLSILSTSYRDLINPHLVAGGVIDVFDRIVGAEDTPERKPSPRVFDTFVTQRTPEKLAYVGDALVDWEAARDARLGLFLAVTTGFSSAEEFLAAGVPENQILLSAALVPQALGILGKI